MIESSGLAFSWFSNSIVYDMPEHPPCLTPILRHKSSFRSLLILFKCFNALSVKEIAGATPPDAGLPSSVADRIDKDFLQLKIDGEDRKESEED
ncbi:hypothetical protein FXO38_32943 [Capsicum annuum]|nr:hypothetical protein FXO38_32943 [Capsicum annuum]